ncbi:hypothetical protein [Streptomyces sp. NRRL S-244]|uniref:hypothetical protein n=1 Tax=Streptomyces sp. NRRL S-244 TaxID=1463897 RepID=UPI00131A5AEC|nr:hypothetical protein [Streptomyces sp. NRRL S-244]
MEQLEEGWRERLRTVLEADQAAVRELTELLDEVNPGWRDAAQAPSISISISGGTFHDKVFQSGRDINVNASRRPDDRGNSA